MQNDNFHGEQMSLNFIETDTQLRAELVRVGQSIGHHCELYADMLEIAAHPPRSGLIIVRDRIETGELRVVLERLLGLGIWLPVVVMDYQPAPARVVQAIKDGALDYLVLPLQADRLAKSIARISEDADRVSTVQQRTVLARDRLSKLSGREREVLDRLTLGGSNKEIARQLEISPRTVEIHRANMMSKLGARHAADAVRMQLEAQSAVLVGSF